MATDPNADVERADDAETARIVAELTRQEKAARDYYLQLAVEWGGFIDSGLQSSVREARRAWVTLRTALRDATRGDE